MADRPACIVNIHAHLHLADDLEARVRLWREWHVRKVCCAALHPKMRSARNGGFCANADVAERIARYPDLIVGLGYLDFGLGSQDTPDQVDRLREQGFAGLKVISPSAPLNDDRYFPFYERAQALGMPILFHTGFVGIVKDGSDGRYGVDSAAMRPIGLDRIARVFPALRMVAAHLGYPWYEEAVCMLNAHPNVYGDISGGSGKRPHEQKLLRFLRPFPGANLADETEHPALVWFRKLCFGTDNPEPSVWVPVAQRILDVLQIPEETRERFWWRNAAGLFGWNWS